MHRSSTESAKKDCVVRNVYVIRPAVHGPAHNSRPRRQIIIVDLDLYNYVRTFGRQIRIECIQPDISGIRGVPRQTIMTARSDRRDRNDDWTSEEIAVTDDDTSQLTGSQPGRSRPGGTVGRFFLKVRYNTPDLVLHHCA